MPVKPGNVKRQDSEYERQGTCSLFVTSEPLAGKRSLCVCKRRTKADWAHFVRDLIDVQYPQAEKIVLVMDNLNTHMPSSFYETFAPEETRRLTEKVEIHYTPKHGSWLNMAEIELSVMAHQRLSERMSSLQMVQEQVAAWQQERNQAQTTISWRFTTQDARIKFKRLYPSLEV